MDPYEETFSTWNKIAGLYEEKFMHLDIYNASYDSFCEFLSTPNARVLELGCGPGNIARYILNKKPGVVLEGCDVAENMVMLAAKNNPEAHFFQMDLRKISHLTGVYQGIVCGFCLPYLSEEDCKTLLQDCYSLLEPSGILYLSYVAGNPDNSGFQTGSSGDRTFFYFHSSETLTALLYQCQFKILQKLEVAYRKNDGTSELHDIVIVQKT